jgi:hypothetical protein
VREKQEKIVHYELTTGNNEKQKKKKQANSNQSGIN